MSRYALDITVPGTVTPETDDSAFASAILIPARSTASGVNETSTASSVLSAAA